MPTYAFVSEVSASPTILFDLDNQSPFSVVVGTQTPPPTKRYSQTSSTSRDGDNIAQSSYNDRVLTIELRVELSATAEAQVEGIQKLGRLLDSEQWLMWQHDTMIEPVFFRTRRGDFNIDDSMMVDRPKRTVTLTIPAEPFAYGLAVTGTATIANDPTAATNPMSALLPDVQGDVTTPLRTKITYSTGAVYTAVSTLATPSTVTAPSPLWVSAASLTPSSGFGPDFAMSSVSDSSYIGGSARRFTYGSGVVPLDSNILFGQVLTGVLPGDYRMFARVRGSGVTATLQVGLRDAAVELKSWSFKYIPALATSEWLDMGVARLPAGYPEVDPALPETASATSVGLRLYLGTNSSDAVHNGTLDIEGFLFVPVGLDVGTESRYAVTRSTFYTAGASVVLDGEHNRVIPADASGAVGALGATFAGGFPAVVPGSRNSLTLVRAFTGNSVGARSADPITATTVVDWKYYPRYLYIRPATS